ncbi:MAG: hypothetical protein NBKEAIPA_02672 [Nitrospirae bacterium]|nr:MAG: hypothetical protein UZ03_NOB001000401 [Nitrospira sp. OLB3]MBV6470747.1 hypothetical protein [Nitrospirota bacterium]MCE7964838.1 hypothetical protein [Nitrospira sp. NTP2]
MVDGGISFGAGLLIGGFGLMLAWGLLWLVVGSIGLARQTCGWPIVLSSISSSAIALGSMSGLVWWMEPARTGSLAFQAGLGAIPVLLVGAAFGRLADGRRIGPAFVEGSRMMLHQLLGLHQGGCGNCHQQQPSCQDMPCQPKP